MVQEGPQLVAGAVLLIARAGIGKERIEAYLAGLGLSESRWYPHLEMVLVKVPVGEERAWTNRMKKKRTLVKHAFPSYFERAAKEE